MLVILASVTTFHIISTVLLFVSTISNAWWVSGNVYVGLWFACNSTCFPVINSESKGYLQAVQTTMILATILCCVGFIVFILQLFRLKQGERFVITSLVQLVSAFFIMIGASVYTAQHGNFQAKSFKDGNYGYSFVLAWIALPVTVINGLMYAFLRKCK
ncbi:epithelial membrane protein 2-like [Paramormyrops kingsleyae]|uniref:Epithelial membrane protein 2 n=1 Tax=Paramormyrops kingsleyae TaxID=1676925 RepID=A0A3B3SQE7_9TELE|nr:epithelial membrane protein 2-like [Paramormyrops kingsleyae]XP_023670812.1 epithelial membrane protein 2-like [Paramormyrops kingsleyae]XP_023670814.1 epithelial membrane protein 2-like [Paramormyrops kingsleyae]